MALWPSRPTHNNDLGSFEGVKRAGVDGRLTLGAFHPAAAKTIRSGGGEGMSAPDQFNSDSSGPPSDGGSMLLNVGRLAVKGDETSLFQNSYRRGSVLASGFCGMP